MYIYDIALHKIDLTCKATTLAMDSPSCRICLGGATQRLPLFRRCDCAHFHDSCFNNWLRHRNSETCEVCGTRYEGVCRVETDVVLANMQRQAWVWLMIYSLVISLVWILKILVEKYSQCIYAARAAGRSETSCNGWNAIEELLLVLCGVSTAAISMQALASCVCPTESGLIVSKRESTLFMVPCQGRPDSSETGDIVIEV